VETQTRLNFTKMNFTNEENQEFEREWWGDCTKTFGEEAKQITYAHRMGLEVVEDEGRWPVYDLKGKSVLDIGGGPVSILLKCINKGNCTVIDPCEYPSWVLDRYDTSNIDYVNLLAEKDFEFPDGQTFNECWIYNVLQHTIDPRKIIENAKESCNIIRIFEWIEIEPHLGHPNKLTQDDLSDWLGQGTVKIEDVNENSATGLAFYGIFEN
jgi:2-polyprenyl-3-methyl-5-hydroxy-6-metoxy-1,4-benzoquinol methylase